MIIDSNTSATDLMITVNGKITDYIKFCKTYNLLDMTQDISNTVMNLVYDTQDDLVYNLLINEKMVVSSPFITELLDDIDYSAYSDAYSDAYN